jgi:ribosomal protein S18 acetylase RimI-like enzyme
VSIREYEPRDRDAVFVMAQRLTSGVAPWRDAAAAAAAVMSWVEGSLGQEDSHQRPVFVAEVAGRVVGFASAGSRRHWSGDVDAYVGELAVAADATRQGVARALMAAAETWARAQGYARLTLEAGAANDAARGLYAALGYDEEEVVLSRNLSSRF